MMTIKSVLDSLPDQDKRRLLYAFENGIAQHIELKDGRFIGVNVVAPNLKPEIKAGVWALGTITK